MNHSDVFPIGLEIKAGDLQDKWQCLTAWQKEYQDFFICLDSNGFELGSWKEGPQAFDWIAAGGIQHKIEFTGDIDTFFAELESFQTFRFGHLAYNLGHYLDPAFKLQNEGIFPASSFIVPEWVIVCKGEKHCLFAKKGFDIDIFLKIQAVKSSDDVATFSPWQSYIKEECYYKKAEALVQSIKRGDIYEVNFCNYYQSQVQNLQPFSIYKELQSVNNNPYSGYYQIEKASLACCSMERYLTKIDDTVISSPIKGTRARAVGKEDELLKLQLQTDLKEIAENAMVVDLVRNDLSRIAEKGSVEVPDFLHVHTFPKVHQLISTVKAKVSSGIKLQDIIRATFPMGSMTGAPKINAVNLAYEQEKFSRNIYSGSIGYIDPNNNFDFNVVIRSVVMNLSTSELIAPVGGALTAYCTPRNEWEEQLVKISPLLHLLK